MALQACSFNPRHKLRNVVKFTFRAIVFHRYFQQMVNLFAQGERSKLLVEQPKYLMKCMIPFLHVGLSKQAIIQLLDDHYTWLENTFTAQAREQIYLNEIILHTLKTDEASYYLTLGFDGKVRKEGELALSIRNEQGEPYYILAFTYQDHSFHIGCIQGSAHDNGFSHKFTKAFHGMRPKSFLVESLRLLAQCIDIQHIYAVKNETHIYNAKRYHGKAQRFNLDYDRLWQELDGQESNQWFYELPLISNRRPIEDIKRSRRKTYRSRYAWLDQYQETLHEEISHFLIS
ncbi:MAG: hypothetical protein CENE_01072 [Candidatus Celerinatantimonas neptuna]|nr:MAG: hypothetical protein CENE_01072 [Candidatus Celerinatantimonas neptuna]